MENESIFTKKSFWTLFVIGLLLVLGLLVSWFLGKRNTKPAPVLETQEEGSANLVVNTDVLANELLDRKDSDGDGVPDWEEILWETNPNNPDSDGDGIPDGVEIDELRSASSSAVIENPSDIGLFIQDVYLTASYLEQTGNLDSEGLLNLEGEIAENIYEKGEPTTYTLSDISVVSPSQSALDSYILSVGPLLQEYTLTTDDLAIVSNAASKTEQSDDALNVLADIRLHRIALQEVAVPTTYSQKHLDLLNSVQALETNFDDIIFSDDDVFLGISSVVRLPDNIALYQKALSETLSIFQDLI